MSKNKSAEVEETTPRIVYKFSDDVILLIRELVQLSLLTGTNVVDLFRQVVVEPDATKPSVLTVNPEYVEAYNQMIENLNKEAEEKAKALQELLAKQVEAEEEGTGETTATKSLLDTTN